MSAIVKMTFSLIHLNIKRSTFRVQRVIRIALQNIERNLNPPYGKIWITFRSSERRPFGNDLSSTDRQLILNGVVPVIIAWIMYLSVTLFFVYSKTRLVLHDKNIYLQKTASVSIMKLLLDKHWQFTCCLLVTSLESMVSNSTCMLTTVSCIIHLACQQMRQYPACRWPLMIFVYGMQQIC